MLCKRIIPCLDVKAGRVVKGTNFVELVDAGDPVLAALEYERQGADEIVFLDITATNDNRRTMINIVKETARSLFIPLTVGGGISSLQDIHDILNSGADKISLNSAAVKKPELITDASQKYGRQCVIVAVDAKRNTERGIWEVYTNGGTFNTGRNAIEWCKEAETLGAGEILLTSIDRDGEKSGYDVELTRAAAKSVNIPVIASGGAGKKEDFYEVLTEGQAEAALAASLFHFRKLDIYELKEYLAKKEVPVRLVKE